MKLRGKLAHVACSEGLGHGAAGHHSLHLTQHAKDGLEGLDHLAGLLVGVRAARLALGHAPWGRVHGALRLGALAGCLLAAEVPRVMPVCGRGKGKPMHVLSFQQPKKNMGTHSTGLAAAALGFGVDLTKNRLGRKNRISFSRIYF